MFKKILTCAVLALPLLAIPALADSYHSHERPVVLKGYYGHDAERRWATHDAYGPRHYAEGAWHGYHNGYRTAEPTYAQGPEVHSVESAVNSTQPFLAYRPATAYVPLTTYAPVPIRVYYVTQHEPYYNVPPYAVQAPCYCR